MFKPMMTTTKDSVVESAVGPDSTKDGGRPVVLLRKLFATVSLSAGVLACMNMETIWQGYNPPPRQEVSVGTGFGTERSGVDTGRDINVPSGAQKELQTSLANDELKDENPFQFLSNTDPLNKIFEKGVASYRREAYRSPDYKEETGYDLVSYEITHTDKSVSQILAYLEKAGGLDGADERDQYVMFMVADGLKATHSYFRNGGMIQQSALTQAAAQALISSRLSTGVPFISVSR